MIDKLISMTDFVLEQNKNLKLAEEIIPQYKRIVKYAEFLRQPLKLGSFYPCGERYQNILKHPDNIKLEHESEYVQYDKTYEDAEKRVLFEHKLPLFKVQEILEKYSTVESLLNHKSLVPLKLKESIIKQIYHV